MRCTRSLGDEAMFMKNLEISVKLNITETTLRVHLRRIYRKLGIQGRSNLRDFNSL